MGARRKIKEHKATQREAEKLLSRWLQQIGRNPAELQSIHIPTLKEHTDRYIDSIRPRYRQTSLTAIEHTIRYLHDHFKPNRRIDLIRPDMADQFFVFLTSKGLADATLKHIAWIMLVRYSKRQKGATRII